KQFAVRGEHLPQLTADGIGGVAVARDLHREAVSTRVNQRNRRPVGESLVQSRFDHRRICGGLVVAELTGFVARLDASLQSGGEVASRSDEPAVEFGVRSLDRSRIVGVEGSIRVGRLLAVIKLTEKTRRSEEHTSELQSRVD